MSGAENKTKNPVGRPSQLLETLEKAKQYLYGGWEEVGNAVPSIAGLACYCEKTRANIYVYAEQNEEFKYILDCLLQLQESKLIDNGLTGAYNSTITKLILTKHGYTDKQEIEQNTTSTNNTIVQVNPKDVKEALKQFNDEY